jgi:DUF4097 and DUF4098 domain-containing protein YvlB
MWHVTRNAIEKWPESKFNPAGESMRKASAVLGCVLAFGSIAAWAGNHGMTHRGGVDANSCSDMNVTFDDRETFHSEETFSLPAGQLDVTAARNGGVSLLRGESSQYEVQVCKFVAAENQSQADQLFGQIVAEKGSGKLSVRGPESGREWVASIIIRVPSGASMNVEAHNGPLAARDLKGTFNLNTVNGPISVKNVSGKVTAKAKNGPIAFAGDGGELSLDTQNGPISIELKNSSWQSGKLDARANNGPISLNLPKGYQSGVLLTSSGHAPMSCSADVCKEARKTWDDDEKRIEFGSSSPVIRISTVNGPVSVGSRDRGEL